MVLTVNVPDALSVDLTTEATRRGFKSATAWIESWCVDVVKETRVGKQVGVATATIKAEVDADISAAIKVVK